MPPILLLAAMLVAERVSYVLVGSAGLYLRGQHNGWIGDLDVVPAPGAANLARLHEVLADLTLGGNCPPLGLLATADLVQVRTGHGRLDCFLARGRREWALLHRDADALEVCGVPVLTASLSDLRALRARYKGQGDE